MLGKIVKGVETLVNFFTQVGKIIGLVIQWVIDFFAGLVEFTTQIPDYIDTVNQYINILPPGIKAIGASVISLCLLFLVIGRRGK